MDLIIRSASDQDIDEVRRWLEADRSMGYLEESNPDREMIRLEDQEDSWVAEISGEMIAYASFAVNRMNEAYISFIVKPDWRRKGVAKTFIPRLLEHQDVKRYSKIIGTPHFGDTATEKILRRAGFYQTGTDQNGSIVYERR